MKTISLTILLILIWAFSWPIYKLALPYTPPLLFAGLRTLLGGLLLTLFLLKQWRLIRWRENKFIYIVSSVLNVILFYGLQTVGLQYLPSGLFSVIVYLQPVLIGIMAWLWLGESMSLIKIIGLLIGFIGVITVSSGALSGHISIIGIVIALVTSLSWATGTVVVKKIGTNTNRMWLVAFQCLIGGFVLSGAGLLTEQSSHIVWSNPLYLTGLIYGAIVGIPLSWIIYYKLMNAGEVSKVASSTFLVPLLAVFIGTLVLHEPFTYALLVGLLFIAASIYLVNRSAA
ncbi:DMT family transporter [Paenibacillus sp. SYP-B3998]|uniref:DMT family transporter n=1 Tax=Paenibacillus sp. SYP-B3998 TaxID=2678564 RepID=A0A6G4A025_9BACL|nr:DMT family transporter [Paenibacillus sp. SYP-B3998]